jgi:hypothetical protein
VRYAGWSGAARNDSDAHDKMIELMRMSEAYFIRLENCFDAALGYVAGGAAAQAVRPPRLLDAAELLRAPSDAALREVDANGQRMVDEMNQVLALVEVLIERQRRAVRRGAPSTKSGK